MKTPDVFSATSSFVPSCENPAVLIETFLNSAAASYCLTPVLGAARGGAGSPAPGSAGAGLAGGGAELPQATRSETRNTRVVDKRAI